MKIVNGFVVPDGFAVVEPDPEIEAIITEYFWEVV